MFNDGCKAVEFLVVYNNPDFQFVFPNRDLPKMHPFVLNGTLAVCVVGVQLMMVLHSNLCGYGRRSVPARIRHQHDFLGQP